MQNSVFIGDFAGRIEVIQTLIEGLHALLSGAAHQFFDQVHFSLADMVLHQRRIQQHFNSSPATLAIRSRDQLLRNNPL